MRFDSNQAWKDAAQAVSANRDVLLALAGVFLVVPSFALVLLMPPPEPADGTDPKAMFAMLGQYYSEAWPALLGMGLLSMLGTLTMLALFTDRSRPTVGEAIKLGLGGMLTVIGAQLIVGLAAAVATALVMGAGAASGAPVIGLVLGLLLATGLIYTMIRISLVSPVVMVEGQRNPVAALSRSWDLTGGNVLYLLAFYLLLLVAFVVVYLLLSGGIGMLVALVTSGGVTAAINNLVAACLQAVISVYFVAVSAACHRQLAGPSAAAVAGKFE